MKDTVVSPATPKKENLKFLYDVLNNIYREPELFYSKQEIKELKKSKVFL